LRAWRELFIGVELQRQTPMASNFSEIFSVVASYDVHQCPRCLSIVSSKAPEPFCKACWNWAMTEISIKSLFLSNQLRVWNAMASSPQKYQELFDPLLVVKALKGSSSRRGWLEMAKKYALDESFISWVKRLAVQTPNDLFLVPVPGSSTYLRNHARTFAESLSTLLGLPVCDLLCSANQRQSQKTQSRTERSKKVYLLKVRTKPLRSRHYQYSCSRWPPATGDGQHKESVPKFLIVDDLMTSGATLKAATHTLLELGDVKGAIVLACRERNKLL